MKSLIYLALPLLVLAQACSFTKDLEAHHQQLLAAVGPDVPLSAKRDALGESTVRMMHQAVNKLNPKKGAKYVEAYAKTNGSLLDTLAAQIVQGQRKMNKAERVAFVLGGVSEFYVIDAVELIPKFVKKYKQIRAVSRITGNLKEAVLGKAAEQLGGLLGDSTRPRQLPLDAHRQCDVESSSR